MTGRRFGLYFAWSRPREIGAPLGALDNRFPTLAEFRRALWPFLDRAIETAQYDKQDIAGFLDHVILFDFEHFENVIKEVTGQAVSRIQREDDQPPVKELDDTFLSHIDTLIVVSLDHYKTEQRASAAEIDAVAHFLQRDNATLVVCPHHDIGAAASQTAGGTSALKDRREEFFHHLDGLVPSQQRIGGFARSLLQGLGFPIENRWGLNPAADTDRTPAPLRLYPDLDTLQVLRGVKTFNLHPHLPHLHVPASMSGSVRVLARQQINPAAKPHPFVRAGSQYFNAFLWIPPEGSRAGNIFVCDATLWSAAFEGVSSLQSLWENLARL